MIHYLPLQPAETRYTGFLDRAITQYLERSGTRYARYAPDITDCYGLPPSESFFHPAGALDYRAQQLSQFAWALEGGVATDGDLIFFSDLLMPGPEAIAWTARLQGIEFRMRGLIHGGSFNDEDIMAGVIRWAAPLEEAILDLSERAFVGSHYSKGEIVSKRLVDPGKIVVSGHLIDPDLPAPQAEREDIVIFNSRHSADKQPHLFKKLASRVGSRATYVDTLDEHLTKGAYYELLSRAKVVVSFALHETFGVGVQEAVALGCVPVVPDRLCYREQFAPVYRYEDFDEAVQKVRLALLGAIPVPPAYSNDGVVRQWFAE